MAIQISPTVPWLILLISFGCTMLAISCHGASDDRKVHIVYMGDLPKGEFSAETLHSNMLQEVIGSGASDLLLYSYQRSFNGFAAKLTKEEAEKLAGLEEVVSVFPSQKKKLHTTRSWNFIGLPQNSRRETIESDIIIAMLDTGIWPESESFSDKGFSPPPKKWKGTCQKSSNFTCNNKIIGAKYYRVGGNYPPMDLQSPRDSEGHGSHTASIAAGGVVSKTSFYGYRAGTARGGVPSARIAVYKICWADGCYEEDILAAFDDAIADGVDIISLSVGGWPGWDYFSDSIAIGAFHSMKHGILTSNSAGNEGPFWASIENLSPWSLTVGASTIDRKFETKVKLGNGKVFTGTSANTFNLKGKSYPLIWGGDAPIVGINSSESKHCWPGTMDETKIQGKIVLCDDMDFDEGPLQAGAIGALVPDDGLSDVAFTFPLPAASLEATDAFDVSYYVNTTKKPTATIFRSTEENDESAPYTASFSSRGPNFISADILKPDLVAPGVDILAAWSLATTVTGVIGDNRVVSYNIESGTSMSCPHATAVAVYVKSFHPTWSASAIKSALMTTAKPMKPKTKTYTDFEFAYGAGQINPSLAINPGLVYDAVEIDYVKFLCGQGYTTKQLRLITGDKSSCTEATNGSAWDLNLPTFTLFTFEGAFLTRDLHRTVTNVGSAVSTYTAIVKSPKELDIQVKPDVLTFKSIGEKKSFVVTVTAKVALPQIVSGSLVWDDGVHKVRSPIVGF